MRTRPVRCVRLTRVVAVIALTTAAAGLSLAPAVADPSTGRVRTLDCGPDGTLMVDLGPAEFLTTTTAAIHLIGSTSVLQPRQVTVTFPDGSSVTTLDKSKASDVTCTYTDPAGLFVRVSGTLT